MAKHMNRPNSTPPTSADLIDRIELYQKLRMAVRILMGLAVTICLLTGYSLSIVSRDSAEFVVSVMTLGFASVLILGALFVNGKLARAIKRDGEVLKRMASEEKADPWKV